MESRYIIAVLGSVFFIVGSVAGVTGTLGYIWSIEGTPASLNWFRLILSGVCFIVVAAILLLTVEEL